MIINDLKIAREAGVNPMIIRELEIEFARKKFNVNPDKAYMLQATYQLDPLPGISDDEKMSRLSNGGITETAYIISSNIISFVQRAVFENQNFFALKMDAQKEIMIGYANEIKKENNMAKTIDDEIARMAASAQDETDEEINNEQE